MKIFFMKKLISILTIILFSLSWVFAFDLNAKDKQLLQSLKPALEKKFEIDPEWFELIQARIDNILPNLKPETRSYELILGLKDIVDTILLTSHEEELEWVIESLILIKVIDGDTVTLRNSNTWKDTTYRLIWIDAPETSALRFWQAEEFWKESTNYLSWLLESWEIHVEYDESQWQKDSYDRDLVYLFVGSININESMVENGYAKEYTYDKPYKYQSEFQQAEIDAQTKKIGVWWLEEKEEANVYSWFSDTQSDGVCNIKWNISSKGEKIYHYEWCQSYTRTKISPEKWEKYFCSAKEAEDAGWRVAGNCN